MPDRLMYFGDCRHRQLVVGARPKAVGPFDRRARKSATLDESDPRSKEVCTRQDVRMLASQQRNNPDDISSHRLFDQISRRCRPVTRLVGP
jgi:hypothetical protein